MARLVQGDVGSGKTILAMLTLLLTVKNGCQGCLMVPTEVLAKQHFDSAKKLLEPFGVGNEKPLFAERSCKLLHARILGKNANVLKLSAENEDGKQFDVMYFGEIPVFEQEIAENFGREELDKLYRGRENCIRMNMIYYPETNEFRDKVTLQAVMQYYKF